MKFRNSLWGLLLVGGAIILIISGLGYIPQIGFWKLVLTVFFAFLFIGGIKELSWAGILFPLAFLGITWSTELGIAAITPWPILGAALLGSIGLSLLFKKKRKIHVDVNLNDGNDNFDHHWEKKEGYSRVYSSVHEMKEDMDSVTESCEQGTEFQSDLVFGTNIRYIDSLSFERASLGLVFSTEKIYFDKAHLNNGRAAIDMDGVFSTLELYVPKEWRVDCECDRVGGSYREYGRSCGSEQVLSVRGDLVFSKLKVYYI